MTLDAGCLARLYAQGGPIRADALRAGLPPKSVPFDLERDKLVQRILQKLGELNTLPDLFMLAALRWPDDEGLRSQLAELVTSGPPAHVAPRAWTCLLFDDQREAEKLWREIRDASPQRRPMMPMTFEDLRRHGILDELANVFYAETQADELLEIMGMPRGRRPSFSAAGNSHAYWRQACRLIADGMVAGGLDELVAAAARLFPGNAVFARWSQAPSTPKAAKTEAPAKTSTPAAPAATATAPAPAAGRRTPPVAGRLGVFLCHDKKDSQAVRDIRRRLQDEGFRTWFDEEDLLPGQTWRLAIPQAIRDSHAVIVFLSKTFVSEAGYRQKEVKLALDEFDMQPEGAIYLIPARLEPCDVPQRLSQQHWVNLFEPDGYDKLVRSLRARAAALGLEDEDDS